MMFGGVLAGLLTVSCAKPAPPSVDQRLARAIKTGEWPRDEPRKDATGAAPFHADPQTWSAQLGAWEYRATLSLSYVGEAGEEVALQETTSITATADGRYHLRVDRAGRRVDDPPSQSGREAVWDGKRLRTRLRFGDWLLRDPLQHEELAWLQQAVDPLEVLTDLLGDALVVRSERRRLTLSLGEWTRPALSNGMRLNDAGRREDRAWFLFWGRTHRPQSVRGEVTRHPTHNIVTAATVEIRATLNKTRRARLNTAGAELPPAAPRLFGAPPSEAPKRAPRPEPVPPTFRHHVAPATFSARLDLSLRALQDEPDIAIPEARSPRRARSTHLIRSVLSTDK